MAAAVFDAVGPSSSGATAAAGSGSLTWAHTCSAGANRLLLVGVAVGAADDTAITATATYNGVAMTAGPVVHAGGTHAGFVQYFRLVAPASGAHNVVVTLAGGTATLSGGSVSYTGADQTTPLGTPATANDANAAGTAVSVSVTGTTSGNPVVDFLGQGSGVAATVGAGQTVRWQRATDSITRAGGGATSTETSGGGSVAMTWTLGGADHWAIIGVEVLPASSVVTAQGAADLAGAGSMSGTPRLDQRAATALAGAGSLGATGTRAPAGAAALAGSGSLAGSASLTTAIGILGLAGFGTLAAAATQIVFYQAAAALAGAGSMLGAPDRAPAMSAALAGSGSLGPAPLVKAYSTGALVGTGALNGAGSIPYPAGSALAGAGSLGASPGTAQPIGAGLAGAGSVGANPAAILAAPGGAMAGAGSLGAVATSGIGASLNGSGSLFEGPPRHNLIVNPAAAGGTYGAISNETLSIIDVTAAGLERTSAFRSTYGDAAGLNYVSQTFTPGLPGELTPGQYVSVQVQARRSGGAGGSAFLFVQWRDAANTLLSQPGVDISVQLGSAFSLITAPFLVPATAASGYVLVSDNAPGAGSTVDATEFMVEPGPTAGPYRDAASPGWSQDGTADRSSSTGPVFGASVLRGAGAALAGAGALSAAFTRVQPVVTALAGAGALGASGTYTQLARADLAGAGTLLPAAPTDVQFASASLLSTSALTVTGRADAQAGAVLAGSGVLTVATQGVQSVSVALAGHATVTAGGRADVRAGAALGGLGALGANPVGAPQGAGALAGSGLIVASAGRLVFAKADLAGAGSITAAAVDAKLISAALAGAGSMSGALAQGIAATLAGSGAFAAGTPMTKAAAVSGLLGHATVSASLRQGVGAKADLAGAGSLSAVAMALAYARADLAGHGSMIGGTDLIAPSDHSPSHLGLPALLYPQPTRVIAQSIRTGEFLDWDLPVENLAITWTLSGPDAISGKFSVDTESLTELGLTAWATWIHVEDTDSAQIIASSILRPTKVDASGVLTLDAAGFSSYAKGTPYLGDFELVGTDPGTGGTGVGVGLDPADIWRDIWAYLQSFPDAPQGIEVIGSTGVTVGTPAQDVSFQASTDGTTTSTDAAGNVTTQDVSFVAGPYNKLAAYQVTDCGSEQDALASDTPFDYRERYAWNADRSDVDHWIEIGWPRLGRHNDDVAFVAEENLVDPVGPGEADDRYATVVVVAGAGQGSSKIIGQASRVDDVRVRRVKTISDTTITNQAQAQAAAAAELAASTAIQDITEWTAHARDVNAPLGAYSVGDDVPVRATVPWAGELYQFERIVALTYNPDAETVKATGRASDSFDYGTVPAGTSTGG